MFVNLRIVANCVIFCFRYFSGFRGCWEPFFCQDYYYKEKLEIGITWCLLYVGVRRKVFLIRTLGHTGRQAAIFMVVDFGI